MINYIIIRPINPDNHSVYSLLKNKTRSQIWGIWWTCL